MGLDDIPLFSMLKSKLSYVNARQKLLSENVANADTPGYAPRDLSSFSFEAALRPRLGLTMAGLERTNPGHLAGKPLSSQRAELFKSEAAPDSEARIDGNKVVLEEQMSKMTEARIDYEAALDFYQQSMNLITTAAHAPGK